MTRMILTKTPLLIASAAFLFSLQFSLEGLAASRSLQCESLFYGSLSYPEFYRVLGSRVHDADVKRSLLEPARTWDDFKFRAALEYLASHDLAWVEHLVNGRVQFVLYRHSGGVFRIGPETSHQVDLRTAIFETMTGAGLVYSKKLDRWFFK